MKARVAVVVLSCGMGFVGCGGDDDCGFVRLLDVREVLQCCGDAKQYEVAQATNHRSVSMELQSTAATSGGPRAGLRLTVGIVHCDAVQAGDCTPIPEQTTPDNAAASSSTASASVTGRNIRLLVTVNNDQAGPRGLWLVVWEGKFCGGGGLL